MMLGKYLFFVSRFFILICILAQGETKNIHNDHNNDVCVYLQMTVHDGDEQIDPNHQVYVILRQDCCDEKEEKRWK